MWRASNIIFSALLLAACAAASEPNLRRYQAAEPHMGTLARITLYARGSAQARQGFEAAFARIREMDEELSDYRPGSELMLLCARAGKGPVPVSADLFRVLQAARNLAERTDGAFDITLGPVIRVWREARRQKRLPDPAALDRAKRLTGFRKLTVDRPNQTVELRQPGMQLDLGGIAKGFAADEALKALAEHGITQALVAVSGDIAIGDPPPGKAGWRIGIAPGGAEQGALDRILELRNTAVSTSGDSEQHFDAGGVRYSHIVDPGPGQALTRQIGVTVVARRGIDADSLATAVSVMGAPKGLEFIGKRTTAAALVVWREDGKLLERATENFPEPSVRVK